VFFYDMVGVADSQPIGHRQGFLDVQAELRLQNFMGLQTWNSIRALDFLLSLPDVDPQRIGVTGASGGGTQTFILCAIDDRPAAAFPAVMVSTAMQGGCICENCSYLRIGTGNIELAGLFAPNPLGMSAANDWTKDLERKGLPELKALYKLYGAEDNVMGKAHLEFGHNYNQVSREIMYNFFNKHLKLGQPEPVVEKPFVPVPPKELSVFDVQHPRPDDACDATTLRKYLSDVSDKQLAGLLPKDARTLEEMRRVLQPALRVMISDSLPQNVVKTRQGPDTLDMDGLRIDRAVLSRSDPLEAVRVELVKGKETDGRVVIWVHPDGVASLWQDGKLVPAARKIIDDKAMIFAVEVFRTGASSKEKTPAVNKGFAGHTFGYNRPLLAERVHDILTAVAFVRERIPAEKTHLMGFGKAGPWVVLARGLCGDQVARTAADLHQFNFAAIKSFDDEMMLPGALKYGGLPTLAALCAPHELMIHNCQGTGSAQWLNAAYASAGRANSLRRDEGIVGPEEVVGWLLRSGK
jgi:Acetyl xylan esterase (AXE1)